jgi:hypothetical protein
MDTLASIDATLKELLTIARQWQQATRGPEIASDADLDSPWGNPVAKFTPRGWTGSDCKGLHFSDCPSAFLLLLAETFDYFAEKAAETDERTDKGKPVADYKRKDAARARGWAKRNQGKPMPTTDSHPLTADDIPF